MDHNAENTTARQRLLDLVGRMTDEELLAPVGDDWTVGAELAHLAFWDRVHAGRVRLAVTSGHAAPPALPDGLTDIINNGELPAWRALSGREAVRLFEAASAATDEYVRSLDAATIEGIRAAGVPRLVERFRHRNEHADAIEAAR